jgi:pimeloyl-ACP methyl ester carboxylesterase
VAAFGAVAEQMHLAAITLVVHDFGSVLGYQFAYRYPSLVKRIVSPGLGRIHYRFRK